MKTFALLLLGFLMHPHQTLVSPSNQNNLRSIKHRAFEPGERLRYRMHYGLVDAGEVVLEVQDSKRSVQGRDVWRIRGTGRTLGAFNMFYKVRDVYESYIDAQGIFPWVFVRRVNEGGYKINQDYTFYQHRNKVSTDEGKEFTVPGNVQDMISSFYYARTLDLENAEKGQGFTINVFLDDHIYPMKIKYTGRDTINLRKGTFNCLKFSPIVQEGRVFNSEEDMQVWVSDDANKIPVLAKAKIKVGSVKMQLVEWEGLNSTLNKE